MPKKIVPSKQTMLTPVEAQYQKLLRDVSRIYDDANAKAALSVRAILKNAYWEIGKTIVEDLQGGDARSTRHDHLLERLSDDLSAGNRKGFSVTNLKNMRLVYSAFPYRQLTDDMDFTHLVVLSAIEDEKSRREWAEKTLKKGWKVEELQAELKSANVLRIENTASPESSSPTSATASTPPRKLFTRRGRLYAYRVVEADFLTETKTLVIDCGFFVYRKLPANTRLSLKAEEVVVSQATKAGYALKAFSDKTLKPSTVLYTYAAKVSRIIDADTPVLNIDVGFDLWTKQKLRLRHINAPEILTDKGIKAKAFVVEVLKDAKIERKRGQATLLLF